MGEAPGSAAITSIIGTEICGSSSRGVASMARAPTASDATVTSGVSFERRNACATRPAMPMVSAAPVATSTVSPAREAGEHLDHRAAVRGRA